MASAKNLIVENHVTIEINSSGQFTLYKRNFNATEILAANIANYNSTMSNPDLQDQLSIENTAKQTITIQTELEHDLTIKMADFAFPHAGFAIFTLALLTLQVITLITTRNAVVERSLKKLVIKLTKAQAIEAKQKSEFYTDLGMVLEFFSQ